ncbi:hypothetical protein QOZ80_2AG0128570 [Eleusine coracana subsp. coracana]|nr:hypothetical protein QOZ80_2AG0128570 [Eleusine coracana subsp. coracana]
MPVPDKNNRAAAAEADRLQRSCLPLFCFWRRCSTRSRRAEESEAAHGKRRRRRRRFRLLRLSWLAFSWSWLRKKDAAGKQRKGRRLLLLLKTSMQAKNALASVVVSGDGSALLPATVSGFGDAKKPNRSKNKPRPTSDDGTATTGTRQPQASTATTGTSRGSTASAARPGTNQPFTTTRRTSESAMWRAPSRRHSLQHPVVRAERPAGGGLWTAATTLGVIVLFGRVTAVVFLCSCLYGARFVRARAANSSGGPVAGVSSSRRFGDPVGVAVEKPAELCVTEECKKKVVMAGLLERTGKRPSSRFGR